MDIMYAIVFAIFGLVLGSFYNVVGLRVPKRGVDREPTFPLHKLWETIIGSRIDSGTILFNTRWEM